MSRVKRGYKARRRRKKVLKAAKGYWGLRKNVLRRAKEAILKAWVYEYRDRRNKKRDFRRLWIQRINAGARAHGINYSLFIKALKDRGIELDRKIIADLAVREPADFARLVEAARSAS